MIYLYVEDQNGAGDGQVLGPYSFSVPKSENYFLATPQFRHERELRESEY